MDSFAYLYIALALVGAALASIAVWSRRRALWKGLAVALLAALVVVGYFSYSMLLSRPKALSPDMEDVAGARVLSAALSEDEAIYLWLSIEGTPRFYALPWDQAAAQRPRPSVARRVVGPPSGCSALQRPFPRRRAATLSPESDR